MILYVFFPKGSPYDITGHDTFEKQIDSWDILNNKATVFRKDTEVIQEPDQWVVMQVEDSTKYFSDFVVVWILVDRRQSTASWSYVHNYCMLWFVKDGQ